MWMRTPGKLLSVGLALTAAVLVTACGGGGGGDGGGDGGPQTSAFEYVPDPGFGGAGVVTGQGSRPNTTYHHADAHADGTVAFVGLTQNNAGTFGTLLIEKRSSSGSLLTAFGGTGQVEVSGSPGFAPKDVHLDVQDGSILTLCDLGLSGYTLHKFLANGNPDPAFGVNGRKDVVTAASFKGAGMVVEANGSIVVAGYTSAAGYLMRYLSSGAPDPTWNGGSPYTFQLFGDGAYIYDIVPRVGGGYLVAGRRDRVGPPDMIFVGRFNTSGLPVPGFGSAGFLHYNPGWQPKVRGLVAQPDGACVVYGTTNYDDAFALGVNGQGDVDPSFGLRELDAPSGGTAIGATTHESDGTTTLGLRTTGSRDVTLWKLLGDGSTDSAFGVGGLSLVPVDPNAIIINMEPHPGGGFFAVGYVVPGTYYEGCVMRLIANPQ